MTEAQRKATLKDGQEAGELLLDIESRIGEIALKEKKVESAPRQTKSGKFAGSIPTGKPPKHERLGMNKVRMEASQKISQHPEIVEKIKAKARENEDIPTKTAVLTEIKYEKKLEMFRIK